MAKCPRCGKRITFGGIRGGDWGFACCCKDPTDAWEMSESLEKVLPVDISQRINTAMLEAGQRVLDEEEDE